METDTGIVYVLSNPYFHSLPEHNIKTVKIGMTRRDDVEERMKELYTTGVPKPFECELAMRVKNPDYIENTLHALFSDSRINGSREFFFLNPVDVRLALSLTGGEDVTPGKEDMSWLDDDF